MGFKNKKNRVHPTGNNKKQQRKERKRRRLARLIQRINPFSCCTGDGEPKNVDNQEPSVVEDGCTYQKLMKPTESLHCPLPAQMDSGISKTSPIVKLSVKPNKYPHFARSPVQPSRAPANMTLPATSSSRVSVTSSVGSDLSSDDDSFYPPKSHSKNLLPVDGPSIPVSHSSRTERQLPLQIHQPNASKSFQMTNYRPSLVAIPGDLFQHRATVCPPIGPTDVHQRLPYCRMVQKSLASSSDWEESRHASRVVVGKESEISDDFDDIFEPAQFSSGFQQTRDKRSIKSYGEQGPVAREPGTDCLNEQTDPSDEESDDCNNHQQDNQLYDLEPCSSPEKDVEYFPGEEERYLPLIKTSLRCLRGWLLPISIQQCTVQPEPPALLEDDKPIKSCAINHTLLAISYYSNNLQSGISFRGEQCPYFLDAMFRSVIENGNTVHLENYAHQHKVRAVQAFTLLKTKYDAWNLEWDTSSTLNHKPVSTLSTTEDISDGVPMEIYCPQSTELSLAYHISKIDVDACEALLYTFNGQSMVFVPTGDGRILLMDQHAHYDMDGGAIVAVCPNSITPIQDMLNDYRLEYHKSNNKLGRGIKFSYMRT